MIETGRELLQRIMLHKSSASQDFYLKGIVQSCLAGNEAAPIARVVAAELRRLATTNALNPWDSDDLLAALLEIQPIAVLDELLDVLKSDEQLNMDVLCRFADRRRNPVDAIPCETLVAWCGNSPNTRYPAVASIITFAHRPDSSRDLVWSDQARALIVSSPEPLAVLKVIIDRFQPMSWSGSRAALMEANAKLLDTLALLPIALLPFVSEAKARVTEEVARVRQWETQLDRARDERFE